MTNIDQIDLRILRILQRNGRISNAELAEEVNLSHSACHRRLKILVDQSVIRSFVALVDAGAVNLKSTVFVEIKLMRLGRLLGSAYQSPPPE